MAINLTPVTLSARDRDILDFERNWWTEPGSKQEAIRRRLDLSATRYYELLAQVVALPAAVAYDPLVVHRIRRLQSQRRRARFEGPRRVPSGR
ncbi:MAG: DUF3263 domain-containing protein [Acidimicrobiales bacterium]